MNDREKVIEALESCTAKPLRRKSDKYVVSLDIRFVNTIIALLKEQEHKDKMYHALEEDWKRIKELLKEQENASKRNPVIVCPHCGKRVK